MKIPDFSQIHMAVSFSSESAQDTNMYLSRRSWFYALSSSHLRKFKAHPLEAISVTFLSCSIHISKEKVHFDHLIIG
jgi:hypothetical protein